MVKFVKVLGQQIMSSIFDIKVFGTQPFSISVYDFHISFSEEAMEDLPGEFGFPISEFKQRLQAGEFDALIAIKMQESKNSLVTTQEMADFRSLGKLDRRHVPASDRIVSRSDNISTFDSMIDHVGKLDEALRSNNELAINHGEKVDVARSELLSFKVQLEAPKVHVGRLQNLFLTICAWMLLEFSAGMFSELIQPIIRLLFSIT